VFGSNGRLNLHNPAFAQLWKLSDAALAQRPGEGGPHIETVIGWCRPLLPEDNFWSALRGAVNRARRARADRRAARAR